MAEREPRQKRTRCRDCHREWIYVHRTLNLGPVGNCPACGSPETEVVEFQGYFDSTTDPAEIGAKMTGQEWPSVPGTGRERLAEAPPLVLLDPPSEDALVGAFE